MTEEREETARAILVEARARAETIAHNGVGEHAPRGRAPGGAGTRGTVTRDLQLLARRRPEGS